MIKEITMPAGGQTTDTSTVGTWLVKKGDEVNRGDALLEIETDKAILTVESFAKGIVLAILVEEGDTAAAGEVIAYIGEQSDLEEVNARLGESKESLSVQESSSEAETLEMDEYQPVDKSVPVRYAGSKEHVEERRPDSPDIQAMPNAKKAAKEHDILLKDVAEFTGKNVLKKRDVETYVSNVKSARSDAAEDIRIPLTKMRRIIARRMLESTQNIPVFQATVEVRMDQCMAFRRLVNAEKKDAKISYNDILCKCIEAAIREFPYINSSYTEEEIILHREVNIGLAVSVGEGLVVPVVKAVNQKRISEIADINKKQIQKAREGSLTVDEMSGGTITLSNLGMYPVTSFHAIINPPEVCILALGAIEEKPAFIDGEWKAVSVMNITGSFDHRVIDGAYGAQFLTRLKKIIENPSLALL